MYEATVRISDGGTYARSTAGLDARVSLWCSEHCDLLHAVGSDADAVASEIADRVGVRDSLVAPDERVIVTETCLTEHAEGYVEQYLRRRGCLLLPPLRYADGAKHCRLLSLDADALTAVYRDLVDDGHDVVVERKQEVDSIARTGPLIAGDELLPDLSDRQRETLVEAYDSGYYEIPRETTTAEVADALGIQRRTAEEHLRRAEGKVLSAMIRYCRA